MKYFKKVEGKKVYLSPMNVEDAEKYAEWYNDRRITDGLGDTRKISSIEQRKDWIEEITKNGLYKFSVIRKKDDTLLGYCGFNNVNFTERTGEIGVFIGDEKQRGKGYGTEAVKLLLDYGFNQLNLHNISLFLYSYNDVALACYKKIGFKEYGRKHEAYLMNNTWYDIIEMEMLEYDYRK